MSMEFVKEKSVVKGYLDGKYTGSFDFATGKYYGIRESEIKNKLEGFNDNAINFVRNDEDTEKILLLKSNGHGFPIRKKIFGIS